MPQLPPPSSNRVFTYAQADAALPLVKAIMADVLKWERTVRHLRFRLRFIRRGGDEIDFMFVNEIRSLERELQAAEAQLDECTRELLQVGIEPEGLSLGLVDFPMDHRGTTVYLCWRYGESQIRFWHTMTGGFVERRPLQQLSHTASAECLGHVEEMTC